MLAFLLVTSEDLFADTRPIRNLGIRSTCPSGDRTYDWQLAYPLLVLWYTPW